MNNYLKNRMVENAQIFYLFFEKKKHQQQLHIGLFRFASKFNFATLWFHQIAVLLSLFWIFFCTYKLVAIVVVFIVCQNEWTGKRDYIHDYRTASVGRRVYVCVSFFRRVFLFMQSVFSLFARIFLCCLWIYVNQF